MDSPLKKSPQKGSTPRSQYSVAEWSPNGRHAYHQTNGRSSGGRTPPHSRRNSSSDLETIAEDLKLASLLESPSRQSSVGLLTSAFGTRLPVPINRADSPDPTVAPKSAIDYDIDRRLEEAEARERAERAERDEWARERARRERLAHNESHTYRGFGWVGGRPANGNSDDSDWRGKGAPIRGRDQSGSHDLSQMNGGGGGHRNGWSYGSVVSGWPQTGDDYDFNGNRIDKVGPKDDGKGNGCVSDGYDRPPKPWNSTSVLRKTSFGFGGPSSPPQRSNLDSDPQPDLIRLMASVLTPQKWQEFIDSLRSQLVPQAPTTTTTTTTNPLDPSGTWGPLNPSSPSFSSFPSQPPQSDRRSERLVDLQALMKKVSFQAKATYTWTGQLPRRQRNKMPCYSTKVFLGGIPYDLTDSDLHCHFAPFGPIQIQWPGKDIRSAIDGAAANKAGYVYVIFESFENVTALLKHCTVSYKDLDMGCRYYYNISSRRQKGKEVQMIPFDIGDRFYMKNTFSGQMEHSRTVFVGALHGMLSAEGLAKVMDDLFGGVVFAGLDTDKHKYPLGSGRVSFDNQESYLKAVSAAFVEVKATRFRKKIQIDPYIDNESVCYLCKMPQQSPIFCRDDFLYFCVDCWDAHLMDPESKNHRPIVKNKPNNP